MVGTAIHSVVAWEPDSESDLTYFRSIQWCAEVISNPRVRPYKGQSPFRTDRGMDPVIHGFMFRDGGITRHVSLLAEPGVVPELEPLRSTTSNLDGENEYPVHLDFYTLGSALHGAPRTLYGGILTLIADGNCAKTLWMHRDPAKQCYTAYTNVRFIRPFVTDRDGTITICLKSQISQRLTTQGKVVVIASFEGPGGIVHATAESMIMEKIWKAKL